MINKSERRVERFEDELLIFPTKVDCFQYDLSIYPEKDRHAVEKFLRKVFAGKHTPSAKKSFGSTNPRLVRQAIRREEKWLKNMGHVL